MPACDDVRRVPLVQRRRVGCASYTKGAAPRNNLRLKAKALEDLVDNVFAEDLTDVAVRRKSI
jgi:hypothetical protein